ncbi:RNA polymerase sigma factor [Nesterenkonia populi]|uniref:RNA polymerase sigma factor n=1 Tax=Nesterenkonia populi TaxID=1591087 RepID=UPI0011BDE337|nr:RNA polymerase sigma factor [Nesterenkonia populi]
MEELQAALSAGDFTAARRLAAEAVESGEYDDALAALAAQAKEDQAAAEVLIEALDSSGVVRRFAGAALLDQTAVDDVAQDSLISIAGSISSYDGRGKVTTWVHSIVRRRVVDHLRRQRQEVPLEDDAGPAARISSMIATRTTVRDALAALPELYRNPVVHRDIEGLSYREIAQRLGRAEGTVKAQISRGRAMVAAQLKEGAQDG